MLQIQAVQTVCENHASVNVTDCALQSNAEVRNNIYTLDEGTEFVFYYGF